MVPADQSLQEYNNITLELFTVAKPLLYTVYRTGNKKLLGRK